MERYIYGVVKKTYPWGKEFDIVQMLENSDYHYRFKCRELGNSDPCGVFATRVEAKGYVAAQEKA